jgi:hypothetical protein
MSNKFTVHLQIHEGDIRSEFPYPPMPRVGILEVLGSKLVDGLWIVTNADPEAPTVWVGRADNHNEAILEYLKARLGIYENPELAPEAKPQ